MHSKGYTSCVRCLVYSSETSLIEVHDMLHFYIAVIRPVLEYVVPSGTLVLLQTSLINMKQYKSEHYASYLAAQVSPITPMNPSVIISKRYHYLLAEINWLLIFFINSYIQPAVFKYDLLPPKKHNPQMAQLSRTLSYDIPFARTNKFKNLFLLYVLHNYI